MFLSLIFTALPQEEAESKKSDCDVRGLTNSKPREAPTTSVVFFSAAFDAG